MTAQWTNERFWHSWKSVRRNAIKSGSPLFLLLPEIHLLLNAAESWERHMLLSTLWKTGMKINEAMSMTVADCEWDDPDRIQFHIEHTANDNEPRERQGQMSRVVEIHDPSFVGIFKRYVKSKRLKPKSQMFTMSRQTAHRWLTETVGSVNNSVTTSLPAPITLDTIRHSTAIHLLINGVSLTTLHQVLGYQKIESTRVYEKILTLSQTSVMERITYD